MIRLYALDQLREARKLTEDLANAAKVKADLHQSVQMPGYTHMQRAMPTTVGTWLASFGCGWADSSQPLSAAISVLDQNPLGSAAGFGINGLKLDRNETTKQMGF